MQRHCTDATCLLFFLSYLGGLAYIYRNAYRFGNVAKLSHGIDWRGKICGVDEDVARRHFLFWCDASTGSGLTLLDGTCVRSCPDGTGSTWCPGKARHFTYRAPLTKEGSLSVVVGGDGEPNLHVRNLTLHSDYPTVDVLGYCLPSKNALLQRIVKRAHLSGATKQVFLAVHGAVESWHFLVGAAVGCVIVGYAFLFLMWACFNKLVFIVIATLHVLMLSSACGFGYIGVEDKYNVFGNYFDQNSARLCAFACSFVVIILWVLLVLLTVYGKVALRSTVDSVNATCETIAHLPTLLLQPLYHSAVSLAALVLLVYSFIWVLSLGRVEAVSSPVEEGGIQVAGMHRTLDFSPLQWLYVMYSAFAIVWVLETMNAMGQFAISYAVITHASWELHYVAPVLRGYCVGFLFHLGSLAFGAFVLGSLKILAAVLTFLARQAQDESGMRGALARAVCCCCAQCAACVEQVLSMVNDLVYADIALQGSKYVEAAENVMRVAGSNPAEYTLLKGSATIVRVLGTLVITGVSCCIAYQCLTSVDFHEFLDSHVAPGTSSALQSASIPGTMVATALISLHVATTFMTIFYQTTHTLTYCMLIGAVTVGDKSPRRGNSSNNVNTRTATLLYVMPPDA